jgi:hypothetical protein
MARGGSGASSQTKWRPSREISAEPLRGFQRMRLAFSGRREPADGFAQAHGQFDDGLRSLRVSGRQPVPVGQHELGIAQDPGEGVIDLVAETSAASGGAASKLALRRIRPLRPVHTPFHEAGNERNEIAGLRYQTHVSFGNQAGNFFFAGGRCDQDHWRGLHHSAKRFGKGVFLDQAIPQDQEARAQLSHADPQGRI